MLGKDIGLPWTKIEWPLPSLVTCKRATEYLLTRCWYIPEKNLFEWFEISEDDSVHFNTLQTTQFFMAVRICILFIGVWLLKRLSPHDNDTRNSHAGVYWYQCIILTENYRSHRKLYWIQSLSPWGSAMTTRWNSDGRNVYQITFWNCDSLCHSIIKVPTSLYVLFPQA